MKGSGECIQVDIKGSCGVKESSVKMNYTSSSTCSTESHLQYKVRVVKTSTSSREKKTITLIFLFFVYVYLSINLISLY